MSNEKEIVDLVPNGDGTYGVKADKPKIVKRQIQKDKNLECNKENMQQLFHGIDVGLEFMEGLLPRIKKISNLKNLVR